MTAEFTPPELTRSVPLHRIGPEGYDSTVEATSAECAALAVRMGLPAVHALRCTFQLRPGPQAAILAEGVLQARVVQTCVVSLDDFEADVTEAFRLRFVPAGTEIEEPDPEDDDELGYDGEAIDIGEAAAQQLALALDLYPRKPGAELPEHAADEDASPFAVLRGLRRN